MNVSVLSGTVWIKFNGSLNEQSSQEDEDPKMAEVLNI